MTEAALQLLGLLAGLGVLHALGYGLMAAVSPAPAGFSKLEGLSLGFGLGVLAVTLWMLTLSLLGIPFSRLSVVVPPLAAVAAASLLKKFLCPPSPPTEKRKPVTENRLQGWDWLFVALLAVLFLYAVPRAVLYPVWAWDAVAVWAFKAKAFFLKAGVDFQGFTAHNYYPVEVPLLLSYLYLWMGQVNDHLSLPVIVFPRRQPIRGKTVDLSLTGAFILLPELPDLTCPVELFIEIPNMYVVPVVAAIVRFHLLPVGDGSRHRYGLAVHFSNISDEDRRALSCVLARRPLSTVSRIRSMPTLG